MSEKPLQKEEIINDDENLNIEPELETEETQSDEEFTDPADDDTGGNTPPANKPRG